MGEHFEIDRSIHLQGFLERALRRGGKNNGGCEQHGQGDREQRTSGHSNRKRSLILIHSAVTPQVSCPRRAGMDICPRSRSLTKMSKSKQSSKSARPRSEE